MAELPDSTEEQADLGRLTGKQGSECAFLQQAQWKVESDPLFFAGRPDSIENFCGIRRRCWNHPLRCIYLDCGYRDRVSLGVGKIRNCDGFPIFSMIQGGGNDKFDER